MIYTLVARKNRWLQTVLKYCNLEMRRTESPPVELNARQIYVIHDGEILEAARRNPQLLRGVNSLVR
jgi:hypothetical protein